jgi:sugar lactone lactonase YvrE
MEVSGRKTIVVIEMKPAFPTQVGNNHKENVMKSSVSKILSSIAMIVATLLVMTAISSATTAPVNEPWGITLDAKGNLWVANYGANQVLVYNPSYQQTEVITKELNGPDGIAVDPNGTIYVSNINSNVVTEYSAKGAYQSTMDLTFNLPVALATDGVGNLWVQENNADVLVIQPAMPTVVDLIDSSSQGVNYFLGIATKEAQVAVGSDQGLLWDFIDAVIPTNSLAEVYFHYPNLGNGLAFDASGNIYAANLSGQVYRWNIHTQNLSLFTTVGNSKGIVVDPTRDRVYIADFQNNQILVYGTGGKLLTTIK